MDARPSPVSSLRHDWTRAEVEALFDLPFTELVFRAAAVHREAFDPAEIQLSQLLSIKTGGCAEDCGYCSQSAKFDTGLKATRLMDVEAVVATAAQAKANGADRFCMGAAWRELKDRDLPRLEAMIAGVKALGLETCATLGMLSAEQAVSLRRAGLDFYNHNLDTAPEDYDRVVTTRTYDDRLETLEHVRAAGMSVCCGGIVGMGETRATARACCTRWPPCPSIRRACRSTRWCRSPARRWATARRSTRWNSCAPSRWRASCARARWCGSRRGARR